jgi:tripartite-type tricarboxylate transporter receptor subunit TctC
MCSDLVAITLIATGTSVVIAHPSFAAKTIGDLSALEKLKPGAINCASSFRHHVIMNATM